MVSLLLSCEHATDHIPQPYQQAFSSPAAKAALASHRGVDGGAARISAYLQRQTGAPCITAPVSRLLIDFNRSKKHPKKFSEFSKQLPASDRAALEQMRAAHERDVETWVRKSPGQVLHLAVHTFVPVLDGQVRPFDIGVLYDSKRAKERAWSLGFQQRLEQILGLKVRRNVPYRGAADGLPTTLRRRFGKTKYLGIELEVSQALATPRPSQALLRGLLEALI